MHHMNANKTYGEKTRCKRIAARCLEQILEGPPRKIVVVQPLTSHLINHLGEIKKTCGTLQEEPELHTGSST